LNARTLLLALLLAFAPAGAASACPNCKAQISSTASENSAGVAAGFNWSIYLMLASIFGVGGFVVRMLVKEARRSDAATQRNSARNDA
jgi:heme/copper-type cytochrome/quinol oxidase subunit 2